MSSEVIPAQAVEAAARAIYAEGAYCGNCEYAGWESCPACRECCASYAEAAAPHMLADLAARMAGNDTGTYWDERRDHLTEGGTVRPDEQGTGYLDGIEHAADWILKQVAS